MTTAKKQLVARDQVALGPARGVRLALTSMSYRLFRSGVTVAILALAVAFLVHMVSHGILAQETQRSAQRELSVDRSFGEHITRLVTPDSPITVHQVLAAGDPVRLAEYARWAELGSDELGRARATASALQELGRRLLDLPVAARAVLLSDTSPLELFALLDERAAIAEFADNLQGMKLRVTSQAELQRLLLEERPRLDAVVERIVRGHARAIADVQRAYPGRAAADLMLAQPPDFAQTLAETGFGVDPTALQGVAEFARREALVARVSKSLLDPDVRATVARETRVAPGDVSFDLLLDEVDDLASARWLGAALGAADATLAVDEGRLLELLERARRQRRLESVAGDSIELGGGVFGLTERNLWLIALSFLVCAVGVANAMLMSVTERFTEIATMKCLGAMDRFVMMMFVFEAVVQGVIGGIIGVLLGALLAVVRGFAEFGGLFTRGFGTPLELLLGVSTSFVIGIVLAALAAVGPSFIAARLAPMEAMRVD